MADVTEILKLMTIGDTPKEKRTGLVCDERMLEHRCLFDSGHIEKPERYIFPLERCKYYGLVDRCISIPSRFASEDELKLIHTPEYIQIVRETINVNDSEKLEELSSQYDSVYFHPKTFECALLAAGSTIELMCQVIEGKIGNGMAVVRPPGHHALPNDACGFCFFNNVALAAKYALTNYKLGKILIVDWDAHHGQATQFAFYDDPRVLYFSIHRYQHGDFWPNLRESNFDFVGAGAGRGFNFNVPLNKTGLGNTEYLAIFHNVLVPVAYEFNPDLILVSAGFDSALGCPEGEMEVTPHLYPHLLNMLSGLAGGRMCVILEGGYCLPSLSESLALCLRSLLGDPCPAISPTDLVDDSVVETILNVISVHRPFWQSLRLQETYKLEDDISDGKKHRVSVKYVCSKVMCKPFPTRDYHPVQEENVRLALESKLEKLIGRADLSVPDQHTCIVTDTRMSLHVNKREKSHPESCERLVKIMAKLEESGVLNRCFQLISRKATDTELALVHSPGYVSEVKATSNMKNRDIAKMELDFESVYLCPATYESAALACGSLLQTIDAVMSRKCLNGFAVIRPPGHHAEVSEPCGFCIFNSVAVAVKYAQSRYSLQKILVLDWDVHHGNGTQHIFYKDSNVLYISLHLHHNGEFFPYEPDASHEACGEDAGLGFNINIPWNSEVSDGDYLAAFSHIVLPVAYEFAPDLVIISAGFDAVENDPIGECKVTPVFYGHMTRLLNGLAGGRLVLALEGGYNLDSLSEGVYYSISSLLGDPCVRPSSGLAPSSSGIETIRNVIKVQQKFWKCLQFGVEIPDLAGEAGMNENEPANIVDNSVSSVPVAIPNTKESEDVDLSVRIATPPSVPIVFPTPEGESALMFCVSPLEWCPHLELLQSLPAEGLNLSDPCLICGDTRENWVCLHCYQVYCGRFVNQHMMQHGMNLQHYLTLSYSDLSVWCYACDSYVHNQALVEVKEHAHMLKFGVPIG